MRKDRARQRTHGEALADPAPEWIVMHCLDAFRDASGQPGQHKVPLEGYDQPMSYREAWEALQQIETEHPGEDFSIRRVAEVLAFPS
jgi:hypothetical protein